MRKFFAIIIIFIMLFSLTGFVFAQGRELEIEYPEIAGEQPEQVTTPVTEYFKYIFNFLIWISGIIALIALVVGGVLYLTSAGDPEKLGKARKQILAAFFGIIILLSSYLILRTINPELVSFEMPELEEIVFHPLDAPAPETKVPTLLGKVEEIAEQIKETVIPGIEFSSQKIKELTDNCECKNTQPLCQCSGGGENDTCNPHICYAGQGNQPCPNELEIKENQKRVIAWKDEIMHYRNRAIAEEEDLLDEIKRILDEKIVYYQRSIIIEENDEVKQYLTEEKEEITIEKNLKKDLAAKLKELAELIEKIELFMSEIGTLPDECLINVQNKCQAHCDGKCHDIEEGCQPVNCTGGNPCPFNDIQAQFDEIQNLSPQISQTCDEILNIIDEIIKHKTITI